MVDSWFGHDTRTIAWMSPGVKSKSRISSRSDCEKESSHLRALFRSLSENFLVFSKKVYNLDNFSNWKSSSYFTCFLVSLFTCVLFLYIHPRKYLVFGYDDSKILHAEFHDGFVRLRFFRTDPGITLSSQRAKSYDDVHIAAEHIGVNDPVFVIRRLICTVPSPSKTPRTKCGINFEGHSNGGWSVSDFRGVIFQLLQRFFANSFPHNSIVHWFCQFEPLEDRIFISTLALAQFLNLSNCSLSCPCKCMRNFAPPLFVAGDTHPSAAINPAQYAVGGSKRVKIVGSYLGSCLIPRY